MLMKITVPIQYRWIVRVVSILVMAGYCRSSLAQEADAEGGESSGNLGSVVVRLGADGSASYHSNPYYRTEDMAEDGIVYHLTPRLGLEFPVNEFFFVGLYGHLDFAAADLRNETHDKDREVLHPYLSGKVRYNFSEHTSLAVSDSFQQANVADTIGGPKYRLNIAVAEAMHEVSDRVRGRLWYRSGVLSEDSGSQLFDYTDNQGGAGLEYVITQTDAGREVSVHLEFQGGEKRFEEGNFLGAMSRVNPKTHTYYEGRLVMDYPISSALTARGHAGWTQRDYDAVLAGVDDSSANPTVGASLNLRPGGALSFTLAGSYSVTDSVVFNDEPGFRQVFDPLDPLLNNLDINYRELDLWRVGIISEKRLGERTSIGIACVYERIEGTKEDDLTPVSGQSGRGIRDLTEDRLTVGARIDYRLMEKVRVGINYEHGLAEDDLVNLYDYDTVALTANVDIF